MSPEIIKTAVTGLLNLFKHAIPIVKSIKKQNNAIDDAVIEMVPYFEDDQFERFSSWIADLKIESFAELNLKNIDESIRYLTDLLNDQLMYLGVPDDNRKKIDNVFVKSLLKYAKQDKTEEYIAHVVDEILIEQSKIIRLLKEGKLSFDTYYTLDKEWKSHTKPSIGVDFFTISEQKIKQQISNLVNKKESFYVSHYCAEEATLMLLSTLNNLFPGKRVYIINNIETWKHFENQSLCNCIFIFRYKIGGGTLLNEILNNICIYILEKDEMPQNGKELIQFHKWYKTDLESKFKSYNFSTSQCVSIIKQTSGLFYEIKTRLWRGAFPLYDEFKEHKDFIKLLLVFPSFTQDDHNFLASFVGGIENFKKEMAVLSAGENPILIIPKVGFRTVAHVSDSYALWCKFGSLITSDVNYLYDKKDCLLNKKVSDDLKRGYLDSLSFFGCIIEKKSQIIIDGIIQESLKQIYLEKFDFFEKLPLYEYVEPSPKAVLNFIESNKKELRELFVSSEDNWMTSISPYLKITMALEKIVSYKEYAVKAFELTAYFARFEKLNNSNWGPKTNDILKILFIPWINYSGLSTDCRIRMGTNIYNENKGLGKFILSTLSDTTGPMMSVGYNIRQVNDDYNVTVEDYFKIKNYFLNLIICDANICDLANYLKYLDNFEIDDKTLELIYDRISSKIDDLSDKDKFSVIETIRLFIYDCRYFQREAFKDKDDFMNKLVSIVQNVDYKNKIFKHLFIFAHPKYFFPLLNPTPYKEDGDVYINQDAVEKLYNRNLKVILNLKNNLQRILGLVKDVCEHEYVYDVLLSLDPAVPYKKSILDALIDNGFPLEGFAYIFKRSEFKGDNLTKAIKENDNPIFQSRILQFCNISEPFLDFVQTLSYETQKAYWSTCLSENFDNITLFERVENELLKFESYSNWIQLLDGNKFLFGISKTVSYLFDNIEVLKHSCSGPIADYHVSNILGECVKTDDLSVLEKGARIEIAIAAQTRERLCCLEKYCYVSPKIYLEMFKTVYEPENVNREQYPFNYTLLNYKLLFCPGFYNGYFDSRIFTVWIDEFISTVKNKYEKKDIDYNLGKLFGHSLCIQSDLPIPSPICKFIEENYTDEMGRGMAMAIYQPSGIEVRTVGNGSDRFELGDKYLEASKKLVDIGFLRTADVFERVSNWFYAEGESEEEDAING